MKFTSTKVETTREVKLSRGLEDQDENLDFLISLFEKLQLATVEAADPHMDLISFAQNAHYFAVIMERKVSVTKPAQEEKADVAQGEMDPASVSAKRRKWRDERGRLRGHQLKNQQQEQQQQSDIEDSESDADQSEVDAHWQESDQTFFTHVTPSPSPSPSSAFTSQTEDDLWSEYDFVLPPYQQTVPQEDGPTTTTKAIGLVYLVVSQNSWDPDPSHPGEVNIGIILMPEYQGKGYAREVVQRVAKIAFEEGKCHRLQAKLLGHVAAGRAMPLFTKINFAHEGTRRRSFFSPMEHEWKDVTYMSILDTDWVMRDTHVSQSAPKSLWDALFARHQREREELLRWEARASLRRTSSTGTIKASDAVLTTIIGYAPTPTPASESEMESEDASNIVETPDNGKRKADALDPPLEHIDDERRSSVKRWVESSSVGSESSMECAFDDFIDQSACLDGFDSSTPWDTMDTCSIDSLVSGSTRSSSSFFELV